MLDDPVIFRGVERLLGVAIGGMAIYLGYRLFQDVPEQASDGQVELTLAREKRVILSRIAPGTFFALFGSAVVFASFYFQITHTNSDGESYSGFGARATAAQHANSLLTRPFSIEEVEQSVNFLSRTEAEMDLAPRGERQDDPSKRTASFQAAKLAIMMHAWQEEWGDPVEFELWLFSKPPRTPRPAFERALTFMQNNG
jgi:hypothetical protein